MNHGLSQTAVDQIGAVFLRHPEVEKVLLYGSRAKGNYKPGSDIDLAFFGAGLTEKTLSQIATELDDMPLPYRFDLSIFAQLAHRGLIEHIRRAGVVFYEKKPNSAR